MSDWGIRHQPIRQLCMAHCTTISNNNEKEALYARHIDDKIERSTYLNNILYTYTIGCDWWTQYTRNVSECALNDFVLHKKMNYVLDGS